MSDEARRRDDCEYLSAILRSLPVLVTVRSRDGTYTGVFSDLQVFDYPSPGDLVGQRTEDVLHSPAADIVTAAVRESIDAGERRYVEFPVDLGGEQFWRAGRVTPLDGPGSEPPAEAVMVTFDLSEQKEREAVLYDVLEILGTHSSRPALERAFCDRLVERERYEMAWIGGYAGSDDLSVRAIADADPYLTALRDSCGAVRETGDPGVRCLDSGEVQFVAPVEPSGDGDWTDVAAAHDVQAAAAIPLTKNGVSHGVLAVYLSDAEYLVPWREDLLELYGEAVGYALSAAMWRWALVTDATATLELTITDSMALLSLCDSAGFAGFCRVESVVPRPDATVYYVVPPDGAVDDVARAARETSGMHALDDGRAGDGATPVVVESETPEGTLANLGVTFERFRVSTAEATLTATVPRADAVRSVVELVRERYPETSVSVRWDERGGSDELSVDANVASLLTDRQYEALETAYRYGYFEKDRAHNATEIAEVLGVSRWTFSEHLRLAQGKLLAHLID